ncbi:MarR family transcriptional regulator [freshwater metagenome]|uniref:MarR family transcriptional regulator n=1 Tax=freshwater metagenome TaxID=449393 RepID=A0A094SEJ9_9ZZZZ
MDETPSPADAANDAITQPLDDVIDSDAFIPRLLALLSNALVWRESMLLRREFSLGTNDWRVLSALGVRPGSSATDVSEFLVMNKAVVSKAVNVLISRNLIASTGGPRGSRHLFLTPAGVEMHNEMLPISLAGEDILLSQLSADEVAALRVLLGKLMGQIPHLAQDDA